MDRLATWIDGKKTYFAAAGLLGLALYQLSVGHGDQAVQSFLAALASLGLRHAITKSGAA